jgi:hypothetical protein
MKHQANMTDADFADEEEKHDHLSRNTFDKQEAGYGFSETFNEQALHPGLSEHSGPFIPREGHHSGQLPGADGQ